MSWKQLIFSYLLTGACFAFVHVAEKYRRNRDLTNLLDEPPGQRVPFYVIHTFYAVFLWPIAMINILFPRHHRNTRKTR